MKNNKYYEMQYKQLANEVNRRFKEIKNAGFSKLSPAQNIFKSNASSNILGKNKAVLLKPKKRSNKEYIEAIEDMKKFLSYKTSNLQGYKEVIDKKRNNLRNNLISYGIDEKDVENLTDNQIDNILEFLGSEKGEVSKAKFDSDQIIYAVSIAKIQNEKQDISSIFNNIEQNYSTIADFIRESEINSDRNKGGIITL